MRISISIAFLCLFTVVFAGEQSSFESKVEKILQNDSLETTINIAKVPKQYSVEFGYRNIFSVIDNSNVLGGNKAMHGYGFLFDYAWQLSGLNKKRPAVYLSVPMGYSKIYAGNINSKAISLLSYGWTVRHELAVNKPIVPFVGYGLLLNTLKVKSDQFPGGVMGHQTQFDFGFNFNTKTKLKYFAKIEYSYTSFPRLDDNKRIHFQFADLRFGLRF